MPHDATIHLSLLFYEISGHVCSPRPDHTLEIQRMHAGERGYGIAIVWGVTVSGNKIGGFMYFFFWSFLRRGSELGGVGPVFSRGGSMCYGVLGAFYTGLDRQEDIVFSRHDLRSCMPGFTPCEIPETEEGGTEPAASRGGESKGIAICNKTVGHESAASPSTRIPS